MEEMSDTDYIRFAIDEIAMKYLDVESDEVVYGITMSLLASVYYTTHPSVRDELRDSLMDIFQQINTGETDEFTE